MEGLQTKHQSITPTRISTGFNLYFKSLIFYTISDFLALFFQIKILSSIFWWNKSLVMQQYKVPSWWSRELQMLNGLQIFPADSPKRMAWFFPSSLHSCLLWLMLYFLLLWLMLYFLLLMSIGSFATLSFFFQVTDHFDNFFISALNGDGLPSTNMTLLPETNTCKKISQVN